MKAKEIDVKDVFNDSKRQEIKDFIKGHSKKQSRERVLRNELLAIQYKIEDYIENESNAENAVRILDFIKMYLKTLNITKKEFARFLEMQDSNLHKYLTGERKLNAEIALKLGSFTHTKPEYWYRIQVKNELMELNKEKRKAQSYNKYDFKNLVEM